MIFFYTLRRRYTIGYIRMLSSKGQDWFMGGVGLAGMVGEKLWWRQVVFYLHACIGGSGCTDVVLFFVIETR